MSIFSPPKGRQILFNPFPNKPWFLRVCCTSLLKTLWDKEKLLITSNFSFSHSVFYSFRVLSAIFIKFEIVVCKLFQLGRVQKLLFGKGLSVCPSCKSVLPVNLSLLSVCPVLPSPVLPSGKKTVTRHKFSRKLVGNSKDISTDSFEDSFPDTFVP